MITRNWRAKAACADYNPELWFPVSEEGTQAFEDQARSARHICGACPVRDSCLEDARARREAFGIRGGLSPQERNVRVPLRRRQIA